MKAIKASLLAAAALAILLIYLEAIEWINLFPWNDIRGGNGQETLDIGLGVILLLLIFGLWLRSIIAACASILFNGIWLWLQIKTWWVSYLFGASPSWQKVYARVFGQTLKILPSDTSHPGPDAAHLVLHILIVLALFTSIRAAIIIYRVKAAA